MHAWQFRYPEFKEGQVLSHNDLNLLRDFLYSRSTAHARLFFGFGAACGLSGSLTGDTIRISPGFAYGQGGRELVLEAEATKAASSLAATTLVSYTGISGSDGYTPILRAVAAADTAEAAGGECDEDGCATHTEIRTLSAEIVWARGKLTLTGPLAHAIFALTALPTTVSSADFNARKTALATHLTGILDAGTLDILRGYSLESASAAAGRNLIRIGIVNEVLYTAWAYFRCQAELALSCLGVPAADPLADGRPGVALGWVHQVGSAWTWDAAFRHEFQLSRALYLAVNGGGTNLCQRFLDHIRVILQEVAIPVPPPTGGTSPPTGPEIDICKVREWKRGRCGPWWGKDPRERLPYDVDVIDPSRPRGPRGPYPPEDLGWGTLVIDEILDVDILNVGLVRTTPFINTNGPAAKVNLVQEISKLGVEPKVDVLPVNELSTTTGFQANLVVSAGDRIVLGVNGSGAVVSMGSVPTQRGLADVAAVPGMAAEARTKAELAISRVEGLMPLQGDVTRLEQQFANVQVEWRDFKLNLPREEVLDLAGQLVIDVGRLAERAETFGRTLDRLQTSIDSRFSKLESTSNGKIDRLRAHVNTVDTEIKGMVRENRHRVERQRVVVERMDKEATLSHGRIEEIGRMTGKRIDQFGSRMDTQAIAIRTGMTMQDAARARATNESLVGALDALAAAAKTAATGAQRKRVDKLLARSEEHFDALRVGTTSTLTLTETAPFAVLGALAGIVGAMEASGVAGAALADMKAAVAGVERSLKVG